MEKSLLCLKSPIVLAFVLTFGFVGSAMAAPDLYAMSVRVLNRPSDNTYYPGDSFVVDCGVGNDGDATSDSYTINFYAGSYSIGSESRGALAPGETDLFLAICSLPADIPVGSYSITAKVSSSNDANPGNNSTSDGWNIKVGEKVPPNMIIRSIEAADGIYRPGASIVVTISIDAVGGQLTGSCNMEFYASPDRTISVEDYRIGDSAVGGLNPGDSYAGDVLCHLPSDMPAGHYYIGVIVTYPTHDGSATKEEHDNSPVYVGIPSDLVVECVDANDGKYVNGDKINVYTLITNVGEDLSTSYTVEFYISTDTVITSSDYAIGYVNRNGLPPNGQHSYTTTCQLPSKLATGRYYVGIIVTCSNDNDTTNNTGYDAATVELVHPPGFVCGQITYRSRDDRDYPIRCARVEILAADNNNDPLDDRLIVQTNTDEYGNYSIVIPDDVPRDQNIYVKVLTEGTSGAYPQTTSRICSVKDDIFKEVYSLQSSLYPHPGDSFVVVNISAANSGGEFMVYDSVVEGFARAKMFFGIDLAEITAYWPSSDDGTYYDPSSGIFVCRSDRGDRDVIMHEYGHYIADVHNFAQGSVGDNPVHYWNLDLRRWPVQRGDKEARNLAFRESWASLFGIATQYGDTRYPYSGDTKYQDVDEESGEVFAIDLERDDDERCTPGEFYENMNCCALWDIFDEQSSDGYLDLLSDTLLTKIWTVMQGYRPDDIVKFWNSWFQVFQYEREMKYIFRNHEMSFPVPSTHTPPPNSAPVADAGENQTVLQTHAAGAQVTLSGSGYDPDNDPLTYEWSWGDGSGHGSSITPVFSVGVTSATLTVSDGQLSDDDTVEVTVVATDPSTWLESR